MPTRDLEDLSTALVLLRRFRGESQERVAAAAGIHASSLSEYEKGKKEPSDRNLRRILAALRVPLFYFDALLVCLRAARQVLAACDALLGGGSDAAIEAAAAAAGRGAEGLTRAAFLLAGGATPPPEPSANDRLAAPGLRDELEPFSHPERMALIQAGTRFRSWALAELYCANSLDAVADQPQRAMELAELAVHIAHLVPGTDNWRRQLVAHCETILGNAFRVSGNLPVAEEAFARSRAAWPVGERDAYDLLDVSRRLELEASLSREERHIGEALDFHDRALALCPPASIPRILVNRAKTLEEGGEHARALATLAEALSIIDPADLPLLFAARFNVIVNLCDLKRYAEAEPLLPEVRELAERLDKKLHRVRLRWLEGRIAAGLGQVEEAIAAFREVRDAFASRKIAYDAALVTLELAVLLAEQGRTAEVKQLASETETIFKAQRVERERLGALRLFCEAAQRERLTAELARRLLDDLRRETVAPGR
jgi:transcriptional regulator with XRE-family HTH domain